MSALQTADKEVIGIVVGDPHLSQIPPLARAAEKSWYDAMRRTLIEIRLLQEKYRFSKRHNGECAVLCPGDIFHHWKSPPELINFAIEHIHSWFTIPGQHDLPFHNLEEIEKSAYWTLCKSGAITDLSNSSETWRLSVRGYRFRIHGHAWGVPIRPLSEKTKDCFDVALIHKYASVGEKTEYVGAPKEGRVFSFMENLKEYNVVIFGDNHIPWDFRLDGTTFWNCGSLMRRTSDQLNYKPRVGLLHPDGTITSHYLDISQDVFTPVKEPRRSELEGLSDFVSELSGLKGEDLDFPAAIRRVLATDDVSLEVKQILLKAIEE